MLQFPVDVWVMIHFAIGTCDNSWYPLQVVHPSAQIIAETGPIVIGENCIIEEYAKIINRIPAESPDKPHTLTIGANNIFEVGSTVKASKIGEKNIFECKSFVSSEVSISNGCVICAGCSLSGEQHLPENTVIFGKHCQQREALDRISGSHMLQLDFLRKILPNYHHLRKPKQWKLFVAASKT